MNEAHDEFDAKAGPDGFECDAWALLSGQAGMVMILQQLAEWQEQ